MRGGRLAVVVVAAMLVSIVGPRAAAASTPPVRSPVIDGDWADPEIVFDPASGRWYSFATNFTVFGFQFNVPVKSSSDLVDWSSFGGDALPTLPAWATGGRTWAPGVALLGSQWTLWFTARHTASGRQCIGVATAANPGGPYRPVGASPLVCQVDRGGSIDARPFLDPATGTWWLHWKSDENAPGVANPSPRIWAAPLAPGGTALAAAPTVVLSHELAVESPTIEAPAMVHAAGKYWLFYAAGSFAGAGYHTHVASCTGPAGPCTRLPGAEDPFLGPGSLAVGPGGASLAPIDGQRWAIQFHGWWGGVGYSNGSYRASYLEVVTFDGPNGAPRLRPDLSRVPPASSSADGRVAPGALAPSVAGAGSATVEAWRGAYGQAMMRYGSTAPRSWGGILTSGPDVTVAGDGDVTIAGAGTDRSVWFRTATVGWRSIGGQTDYAPAIVASEPGRLDVFVRGIDGALWHRWTADGGWSWAPWASLGGLLTDGPDVAAGAPGQLDVVGRGVDGAAWHLPYRGGWQGWRSLGGFLRGAPSVAAPTASEILLAVRGGDDALYLQRANPVGTGWIAIGGQTDDRPGIGGAAGWAVVVVRGIDGRRWRTDVPSGGSAGGWYVAA
jgi:hypothetical protein